MLKTATKSIKLSKTAKTCLNDIGGISEIASLIGQFAGTDTDFTKIGSRYQTLRSDVQYMPFVNCELNYYPGAGLEDWRFWKNNIFGGYYQEYKVVERRSDGLVLEEQKECYEHYAQDQQILYKYGVTSHLLVMSPLMQDRGNFEGKWGHVFVKFPQDAAAELDKLLDSSAVVNVDRYNQEIYWQSETELVVDVQGLRRD